MSELDDKLNMYAKRGEYGLIKEALDTSGAEILKRYISEESIAEKIIPAVTKTVNDNDVLPDTDLDAQGKSGDSMFVLCEIEQGRTAQEVNPRANWNPDFVEGRYFKCRFGKLEADPFSIQRLALDVNPNVFKMMKEGSGEGLRRLQDVIFMTNVNKAIATNGNQIGGISSNVIDFSSTGFDKQYLISAINKIQDEEVDVDKLLMSTSAQAFIAGMSATEIGDMAGDMLIKGFDSNVLLGKKVVTTKKSKLAGDDEERFFITKTQDGKIFYHIYIFSPAEFLGKIFRYGSDSVESKWENDIMSWKTWRYWGMGFGDVRGMARFTFRVK